ncbi:hypothetical protein Tco_0758687 [Tanacetum coccineum]
MRSDSLAVWTLYGLTFYGILGYANYASSWYVCISVAVVQNTSGTIRPEVVGKIHDWLVFSLNCASTIPLWALDVDGEDKRYGCSILWETDMVKLVVEIECFGTSFDEFDKETESSDGLQPMQVDLSCIHALNEPHLHEIHVVLNKREADQFTPFSSIEGQMSGPFSMDSRIILSCCLFIMYSSILLFQESYISFSNIGRRLSAPKRIALSARVFMEKFVR